MKNTAAHLDLSVAADVDIVIVGATAAAVAAALSAKRSGASVFLVSPRPYLGEDICGLYRFWPQFQPKEGLAAKVFPNAATIPTPMHVKLTLEQSMVKAEIPFVFNCFPAGVLRDEKGQVQGVAIANRTGIQAITARTVVDATIDGMVLQQAGYGARLNLLKGLEEVEYATFCEGEGSDAANVDKVEHLPGYQTKEYSISARRYRLTVDCADGSPVSVANAYSEVVERCRVAQEYRHQARIVRLLPATQATPTVESMQVELGLYGLSEALRMPDGAEAAFCDPVRAIELATTIGTAIASHLPPAQKGALSVVCDGSQPLDCGQLHMLRDSLRPGAKTGRCVTFNPESLPLLGRFDVVVVGGGTGGAPAAIASGRAGASTLVVELTSGLGGVGTMGQIAKYWYGNRVGFTSEIDRGVKSLEYKDAFRESDRAWSVSAKQSWYHQTGRDAGCTYWFNTLCAGVCLKGDQVTAVLLAGPYGYGIVETGCVVDSTGGADIPAMANAPVVVIDKEHLAVQGTGIAGLIPGKDYRNSDHNFSDDTDVMDTTAILTAAKLKFKDDFDCGELVDTRERRQIVGETSINSLDILYERTFPDTICRASSNFDSHGFTIDPVFMLEPADQRIALWADIPLRCLLPVGLEGVLVTGLGISAHRDALPVIRMQADVQNQGYAAGYIAALSALSSTPIRQLNVRDIQQHLVQIGNLDPAVLTATDSFPLPDAEIEQAVIEGWNTLPGVALIIHEQQRSLPILRQAYAQLAGKRSEQSLRYAQLLAILDSAEGAGELAAEVATRDWDEGWAFRGMGQFGMTLSELDKLLICLGKVGDANSWSAVLEKIRTVPNNAEFSHFRALGMCCESLYARHPNFVAAEALADLLQRPGYRGHAQQTIDQVQSALSDNINDNQGRDLALRELHLARALYRCGDVEQLGESTLNQYGHDLRGHFRRHARAVLEQA